MTPLTRIIELLREAGHANRAHWRSYAMAIDRVERVGATEAGACAFALAGAARSLIRQLPHAHESAEPELRAICLSLANALQIELNERGNPDAGRPYYAKER